MTIITKIRDDLSLLIGSSFIFTVQENCSSILYFERIYTKGNDSGNAITQRFIFTLIIKCPWRLRGNNGIITGFNDRFFEKSGKDIHLVHDEDYRSINNLVVVQWISFIREMIKHNDADYRTIETLAANNQIGFLQKMMEDKLIVHDVNVDGNGDMSLVLSDGFRVEVFPDGPLGFDQWSYSYSDGG